MNQLQTLSDLQQHFGVGDGTPWEQPRPKQIRVERCKHGLRCDREQWLCEACAKEPWQKTLSLDEYSSISSGSTVVAQASRIAIERQLLTVLSAGTVASLAEATARIGALRGKKQHAGCVAKCLYRLRREGKVEGWRVVK